jgi:broad specificity phosphatase PhoE
MSTLIRHFWFVRHAEREDFVDPDWPKKNRRHYDTPISDTGHEQARETAQFFKQQSIQHIFVSPFHRTLETATPIAEELGLKLKVEDGLCEILFERWFDTRPLFPGPFAETLKMKDPGYISAVTPVYPETIDTVRERGIACMDHILNNFSGNILCVSHGGVLWELMSGLTGQQQSIEVPFCCIIHLTLTDDGWTLERNGSDVSHLSITDSFNRIV